MLHNKLKLGSLINASKPARVLNRLAGSGIIFSWYQDKLVVVLNRIVGSREISGKEI